MSDPKNNLEEVLRAAHARRTTQELPSAFSQDVMRSVRNAGLHDDETIWLWGAAWTGTAAAVAIAVVLLGGFLESAPGSEWFGDPLGLASMSFFGS
jgi:hypothetical protein